MSESITSTIIRTEGSLKPSKKEDMVNIGCITMPSWV